LDQTKALIHKINKSEAALTIYFTIICNTGLIESTLVDKYTKVVQNANSINKLQFFQMLHQLELLLELSCENRNSLAK